MKNHRVNEARTKLFWLIMIVVISCLVFFWLIISMLKAYKIQLRYQGTMSMPAGIYLQYPSNSYRVGDDVIFVPSNTVENLIVKRGWLSEKEPLLKEIIAAKGDFVCIKNGYLWLNEERLVPVLKEDRKKRALPEIKMCRKLKSDEFWMMGISSPYSFDSRYFGIVKKQNILGKVIKL
ncbi:signal peptidase I [Thiotrichales bacterium 19S3-7]|nr:signal peptidase I [Thiotrichales bacterium 19S3-7]MCF6802398.1 signal peptidase I [Thiotrichales bacterium 19S3-11]